MKIAIIGTGNIGGTLATKWAQKGHEITLGVRDITNFKGKELLNTPNTKAASITEAVANSEVILIATPAIIAVDVAQSLGNTQGKIIIDSMYSVMGRGPAGFTNVAPILLVKHLKQVLTKAKGDKVINIGSWRCARRVNNRKICFISNRLCA